MNKYFTSFRCFLHLFELATFEENVCSKKLEQTAVKKEQGYFEQKSYLKQKSSESLTIIDWHVMRAVYIASFKFSESKRFVQRLNKVEQKYIQEEQQI